MRIAFALLIIVVFILGMGCSNANAQESKVTIPVRTVIDNSSFVSTDERTQSTIKQGCTIVTFCSSDGKSCWDETRC